MHTVHVDAAGEGFIVGRLRQISVEVFEDRDQDLDLGPSSFPDGFHQAWEAWMRIFSRVDSKSRLRKLVSFFQISVILANLIHDFLISDEDVIFGAKDYGSCSG